MTRKRALSITAIVVAAHYCLLPSCVQWNIGQNIRESTERHVGINPGEAYRIGDGGGRPTIAQELTYELDTPLISLLGEKTTAQDIRMGEHFREVKMRLRKMEGLQSTVGARYEPKEQPMERMRGSQGRERLTPRSMGSAEVQYSDSHQLAVIAAAPFDYLIDPVLSAASSAIAMPLVGAVAVACIVHEIHDSFSF